MTSSTLTVMVGIIAALTLNIRAVPVPDDPRLAEELKCLGQAPAAQCNVAATYPSPLNTVACDQLVPTSQYPSLNGPPTLQVFNLSSSLKEGLLVMFDPDAHVSTEPSEGYLHWLAQVAVDTDGNVQVKNTISSYHSPAPPAGNPHRYQLFLFDYPLDQPVFTSPALGFKLCQFKGSNALDLPVASFQFQYKS